jgi:hypothetical protein
MDAPVQDRWIIAPTATGAYSRDPGRRVTEVDVLEQMI